ncbi:MAG: protein phosphatase 2C domain-containing protein [Bacilli bacterium]|nr:protein phosphatase 2C domain-containing protein [Bacilli bacterium]
MAENPFRFNKAKTLGLSHKEENLPCQDSVAYRSKEVDGVFTNAIVLSDGCSRSMYSDIGSQMTVDIVSEYLLEHFDDIMDSESPFPVAKGIIEAIIDAEKAYINDHLEMFEKGKEETKEKYDEFVATCSAYPSIAESGELDMIYYLRMLNGTLLFVVSRGDQWALGQIGDGYIMRLTREGAMEIAMMEDKDGEHNYTEYPASAYLRHIATGDENSYGMKLRLKRGKEPMDAWILISDGPENTFIEKDRQYLRVRNYVWNVLCLCTINEQPEEAQKILQSFFDGPVSRSTVKHGGDDISTVLMVDPEHANLISYADLDLDEGKPAKEPEPEATPEPDIQEEAAEETTEPEPEAAEEEKEIPQGESTPIQPVGHTPQERETFKRIIVSLLFGGQILNERDLGNLFQGEGQPFTEMEIAEIVKELKKERRIVSVDHVLRATGRIKISREYGKLEEWIQKHIDYNGRIHEKTLLAGLEKEKSFSWAEESDYRLCLGSILSDKKAYGDGVNPNGGDTYYENLAVMAEKRKDIESWIREQIENKGHVQGRVLLALFHGWRTLQNNKWALDDDYYKALDAVLSDASAFAETKDEGTGDAVYEKLLQLKLSLPEEERFVFQRLFRKFHKAPAEYDCVTFAWSAYNTAYSNKHGSQLTLKYDEVCSWFQNLALTGRIDFLGEQTDVYDEKGKRRANRLMYALNPAYKDFYYVVSDYLISLSHDKKNKSQFVLPSELLSWMRKQKKGLTDDDYFAIVGAFMENGFLSEAGPNRLVVHPDSRPKRLVKK